VHLTRATLELRLLPSRRTSALLGAVQHGTHEQEAGPDETREAQLVGVAVAGAARRLPWHPTCLRQALAAQRMLRRRGIDSRLHLGVTGATATEAHAWVTVAGRPVVGGQGLERYVPLAAFR
jgi:hypothetical protein